MIKKFAKGLLVGSIVGGGLGLLFAPKKGKETRQGVIDSVDDATTTTTDLTKSIQRFNESLVTLKKTAAEVIPVFTEDMADTVDEFKFQAEPRMKEITKQVEKIQNTIDKKTNV
ncbi:YtxH domain-containing protein [Vagococcus sp. PNs007]|uniref:YtxH domain-containing protein n=1 Tax=Vagococcus proximus TaxID=2991417 RepID=A0ABT5WZX1_9ENTE|nr:YtxH domain-containing protein [Vagococcus proximus]MDF0479293.1 YtxH domain-containing protein [Vagococcus proximus]